LQCARTEGGQLPFRRGAPDGSCLRPPRPFAYTRVLRVDIRLRSQNTVYIIICEQIHVYLWTGTNFVYVYKIMIGFKFWRRAEETEEEYTRTWPPPPSPPGPKWNLTNDCNSWWRTKTIVQYRRASVCVVCMCVCRPGEHQNFNTINDWFIAFGSYRFSTPPSFAGVVYHNYQ